MSTLMLYALNLALALSIISLAALFVFSPPGSHALHIAIILASVLHFMPLPGRRKPRRG